MKMGFSERQKVSQQLEDISETMKEQVKLAKDKQKLKTNTLFKRIFSFIFPLSRLLGKRAIHLSDFGYSDTELSVSHLYDTVQSTIDTNLSKANFSSSPVTAIFGNYDAIITEINRKNRCCMYFIDLLILLCFSVGIALILVKFDGVFWQNGFTWRTYIYITIFFLVVVFNRVLEFFTLSQDFKIKARSKIVLQILVYYKLIISDLSFLRGSDNNLIYRLFYWEAEEYSQYYGYLQVSFFIFYIGCFVVAIGAFLIKIETSMHYFAIFMLLTMTVLLPISYFRSKYVNRYRETLNQERATIYELIHKFRSATYTNLKKHYMAKLQAVQLSKIPALKTVYTFIVLMDAFSSGFIIGTPALIIGYLLITNWAFLCGGGIIDEKHYFSNRLVYKEFVAMVIIHSFTFMRLRRFFALLSGSFKHRSSKQAYNAFFLNDSIVQRSVVKDPTLGIGEIEIQDCSVFERLHNRPNYHSLESWFKQDSKIGKDPLQKFDPFAACPKPFAQDQKLESGKNEDGDLNRQESSRGTIVNVIQHLTLKISSGHRICVYQNKHKSAINGFIKMLIGENITTCGSIRFHGKISFFSKEKMPFLVGKTIRNNILFGEDYDMERYDLILSRMRINFNKYRGRDFYQLSEQASNIKTDDRLNILIARFLYRDSNIYIIEDLFTDINFSIVEDLVERLFKNFFQGKTIIYVAKVPELVAMADQVLRFSSDYKYTIKRQNHNSPVVDGTPKEEKKEHPKIYTSQGKIKNSIFLENASYEEELAIHKKLQLQKKDIESKIGEHTNIIEKIAYGIYLTNKRRQEGKNVDQTPEIKDKDLIKFVIKLFFEKGLLRCLLMKFTVLSTLSSLPLIFSEYLIMVAIWGENFEIRLDFWKAFLVISLFLLSIIILSIKSHFITRIYLKFVGEIHEKILQTLLLGDYNWISRFMFHDILSKTNEHLMSLDIHTFRTLVVLGEVFSYLILSFCFIIYMYSILIPLILIGLYSWMIVLAFKILLPSYFRAVSLTYYCQSKRNDFMFQLLNLVFGHRITGKMQSLNVRFLRLFENLIKSERLGLNDFKNLLLRVTIIPRILLSLSIVILTLLF